MKRDLDGEDAKKIFDELRKIGVDAVIVIAFGKGQFDSTVHGKDEHHNHAYHLTRQIIHDQIARGEIIVPDGTTLSQKSPAPEPASQTAEHRRYEAHRKQIGNYVAKYPASPELISVATGIPLELVQIILRHGEFYADESGKFHRRGRGRK